MNRRELLVGAGVLAIASAAKAVPQQKPAPEAHHHEAPNAALVESVVDCQKKAEACLTHCIAQLGSGDTSMAACAATTRDTIASSQALATVASAGSKHTKALAQACADICKDCEAECRKHAAKHEVCKVCADACAKMIQEVSKLA